MDVVVLFNGLGNQMSQYAFYLQKKKINNNTFFIEYCKVHNGAELNEVFKINLTQSFFHKNLFFLFRVLLIKKVKLFKPVQRLLNLLNFYIIEENFNYIFNKKYLTPATGITFYYGGWSSEKYFLDVRNEILDTFKFPEINDPENIAHIKKIKSTNSVAMHVRRGDYLSAENIELFGNVCTKEYFEKAIDTIKNKVNNPIFFIFSNDIAWVKNNLKLNNANYITCNKGKDSWKDMYLMSIAKHNIISNSTFSWWGAWLNINPHKIVISPSRYLNKDTVTDFYSDSWVKLSDY